MTRQVAARGARVPYRPRSRAEVVLDPMILLCQAYGLPGPSCEHPFAKAEGRRWRFDWAWPDRFVAVEQEGGIWSGGRHTRGKGFLADLEKYNAATLAGWAVFRFTPQQIERAECLGLLQQVLR